MKLSRGPRGGIGTLTPTLSRKQEREQCPLSPGTGGEGWGEGWGRKASLLSFIANQGHWRGACVHRGTLLPPLPKPDKDLVHAVLLWPIVRGRRHSGVALEPDMSHQPPKENKKKAQHTAKEKKTIKQQKKQAGQTVPFIKH